jgi:hypothetical protein
MCCIHIRRRCRRLGEWGLLVEGLCRKCHCRWRELCCRFPEDIYIVFTESDHFDKNNIFFVFQDQHNNQQDHNCYQLSIRVYNTQEDELDEGQACHRDVLQ